MQHHPQSRLHRSVLREFLRSEAAGGIVLMSAAALALIVANSPLADTYFHVLEWPLGPLSVLHWINDGLMAVFFLLVGLEMKRELRVGALADWPARLLPGIAALGGMGVPALIFSLVNLDQPHTLRGWAIPAATDIAFALGVMTLLGSRVPVSLKIFLAALAILDDLGAVLIIALFYTHDLSLPMLLVALLIGLGLVALNLRGVRQLWPYLLLGLGLWVAFRASGIHATLAGVVLAFTIPLGSNGLEDEHAPLLRLEHWLSPRVGFLIVPLFGFANAGVSLAAVSPRMLTAPLTFGVILGLFTGKQIGVFLSTLAAVRTGLARKPENASWLQIYGIAVLCGIGFTMSLFIGDLAFPTSIALQDEVKIGVLAGSCLAALAGLLILRIAPHGAKKGA
ncbi:Na+/H+ antiporter NhaA [Methylovirgula sp. 4M-Z18]|uniref:Na+/H+ antiporter NhaA n=2 Tax=Methylovirgula sp. 4M-Z18 TaxID=2293567 RepID=UPI000E2F940F|nr:Na+/H+ antiporter NhaA [Methylovirgula sp. 4M-Z18]RFB81225.1 Na+/H+ antiporter NhaA [Methylovirgula sp. 4M-Z18]